MTSVSYNRSRALRCTWAVLVLAGAVWFVREHRPAKDSLHARESILAEREGRVRQARAAVVALGSAGLDSALTRFRSDSALLALRVPADSVAPALAPEVKAVLGARDGNGLRIVRTDPIPRTSEGEFFAGGYAVTAIGSYGAIHGMLVDLATQPRLLRVRRLRLTVVPDSLVASASVPGGGLGLPPDTASTADRLVAAGAEAFDAVVTFQVVWYSRGNSASAAQDSARVEEMTPSSGLHP